MKSFRKYFADEILKEFPDQSMEIISLTDAAYHRISEDVLFATTSGNPLDKRLDFSSYFLALIITLNESGKPFEQIRTTCLGIAERYVQPRNRLHAILKQLLPKLIGTTVGRLILSHFQKRFIENKNDQGFRALIITEKKETLGLGYGIDILECGICKLFKKHGYDKYASLLCEVDEITSSLAGLQLKRTGTIANGASKCDFRFQKIKRRSNQS